MNAQPNTQDYADPRRRCLDWIEAEPGWRATSMTTRYVLRVLADLLDDLVEGGSIGGEVSLAQVAAAGVHRDTFLRHVRALIHAGYVVALRKQRKLGGGFVPNYYAIPVRRGALDHRADAGLFLVTARRPDGSAAFVAVPPGEQACLFAEPRAPRGTAPRTNPEEPAPPGRLPNAASSPPPPPAMAGGVVAPSCYPPSRSQLLPPPAGRIENARALVRASGPVFRPEEKKPAGLSARGWSRPVEPADLTDDARMLALWADACAAGLAQPTEAGRLWFATEIEHCRRTGRAPGKLLVARLRDHAAGRPQFPPAQACEDAAVARLRDHAFMGPAKTHEAPPTSRPDAPSAASIPPRIDAKPQDPSQAGPAPRPASGPIRPAAVSLAEFRARHPHAWTPRP